MEDNDKLRREYVEKQVIPWLLAHLQMRSVGLQVFVAIQGALMVGYSVTQSIPIIILGVAMCISFFSWDLRNRDVFSRLNKLASENCDALIFGVDENGRALDGLHTQAVKTLKRSKRFLGFGSHSMAIRIVIISATICWIYYACTTFDFFWQ